MPIPPSGPLQVKLGELAHAGVGVPGRRLVQHPVRGWVAEAERAWRIGSLPLWVSFLLPLGVLVGLLVPRHVGVDVNVAAPAAVGPPLQASAPALPAAPLPPVAAPPPVPPAEPAWPVAAALPAPVVSPSRRPVRPAFASPRRTTAAPAPTGPVAPAVFNDVLPAEPTPRARDVLVAIQDGQTIVASGPRGLPVPYRVGDLLPSGARLLRVDMRAGEAQTDRGVIRLE